MRAAGVADLGIRVGDPVTFIGELAEFSGGDRVCGKAMDDRMGVAILLEVLTELRGVTPHGITVQAVGTVLEEVGLRGAIMAAYRLEPDYGGLSAVTRRTRVPRRTSRVMGRGPVVVLAASTGAFRGSIAHPAMKRHLLAAASAGRRRRPRSTSSARGFRPSASGCHAGTPTRRTRWSTWTMPPPPLRLLVRFVADMDQHGDLGFG